MCGSMGSSSGIGMTIRRRSWQCGLGRYERAVRSAYGRILTTTAAGMQWNARVLIRQLSRAFRRQSFDLGAQAVRVFLKLEFSRHGGDPL